MADWYYLKSGEQKGPVTREVIQELAGAGQLQRSDQVWTQGMKEWLPAESVPELGISRVTPPPGSVIPGARPAPEVTNYLVWSIISNLCCFPFTGFVALIYSAKTITALELGNISMAQEFSKKAKMWNIISLCIFLVLCICQIILSLFSLVPMIQLIKNTMPASP